MVRTLWLNVQKIVSKPVARCRSPPELTPRRPVRGILCKFKNGSRESSFISQNKKIGGSITRSVPLVVIMTPTSSKLEMCDQSWCWACRLSPELTPRRPMHRLAFPRKTRASSVISQNKNKYILCTGCGFVPEFLSLCRWNFDLDTTCDRFSTKTVVHLLTHNQTVFSRCGSSVEAVNDKNHLKASNRRLLMRKCGSGEHSLWIPMPRPNPLPCTRPWNPNPAPPKSCFQRE